MDRFVTALDGMRFAHPIYEESFVNTLELCLDRGLGLFARCHGHESKKNRAMLAALSKHGVTE